MKHKKKTLTMPSTYATVDNDEMTYIDGGLFGQLNVSRSYLNKTSAINAARYYADQPLQTAGGASYGLMRLAKEIRAHAMLFYGGISAYLATGATYSVAVQPILQYIINHSNPIELGGDSDGRVFVYETLWLYG